ncbi:MULTISPECIES: cache domain-containing protein [unclassified Acinetobacter]|uniref:cache domain-containing protein n=1 Tax=unclassified Acinetobacter TaxID=196816 RepID=UPI0029345BD5|nr:MULTISPECIES: cache domain-containing protein [unclassified Acinetobacter]WOE31536.1 cache domain-containing protein [Acinetobacter sp. SAAs470]WOE39732.1 cache domain-containing protein [Acinetobacter sp. SAAs474]
MTQNLYIQELQDLLTQIVDESTSTAERLANQTSRICAQHHIDPKKGIKLSTAERHLLQQEIKSALHHSSYSQGMGFASYSPETHDEQDYWTLEWWYKKAEQLQQAQLENYQNAQRFLDFRSFEWFQQPAQNNQPCIYGPYVDYICNGAYTITVAHPVIVNAQFIGVIAIDMLVSALEKLLIPKLKHIKQKAVIINDSARVISSNDVSIRIGTLLKHKSRQQQITRSNPSLQLIVL